MSITAPPPSPAGSAARAPTVGDLITSLGDIAPDRILLSPLPGTATELDLIEAERREGSLFELVDGTLVEKGMGFRESQIAVVIASALLAFVRPRKLGVVAGPDGTMRLRPRNVRAPDVSFVSAPRARSSATSDAPIPDLSPDLAVEVLSPSNTRAEMARKRRDYFNSGTHVVWEADPPTRTVAVYTDPDTFTTLTEADVLDGGDVLPGFTLAVREVFAPLDAQD